MEIHPVTSAPAPLGKVLSPVAIDSKSFTHLPGAPDGKYFVTLATNYKHKQSAIETVTAIKVDSKWRIARYLIKQQH